MTGDQRLILKIEHAVEKLEADQFLAAYHVLDEILEELQPEQAHGGLPMELLSGRRTAHRPPVAAAG